MMYCESCGIELFGGSVCHECGNLLVPKVVEKGPEMTHVTTDSIMGSRKTIKMDTAQSLSGRLFRLSIEILVFCVVFYFIAAIVAGTINWLSEQMSGEDNPEDEIDIAGNGFKYFRWVGIAVVFLLTVKFRFQTGK